MIENFQKDHLYNSLKPSLKKILDVEKLHRRMGLNLLSPYEFFSIHTSYNYLIKIVEIINKPLVQVCEKYKLTIESLDNL